MKNQRMQWLLKVHLDKNKSITILHNDADAVQCKQQLGKWLKSLLETSKLDLLKKTLINKAIRSI